MPKLFFALMLVLFCFGASFMGLLWWNDTEAFTGKVIRTHWRYSQAIEAWQAVDEQNQWVVISSAHAASDRTLSSDLPFYPPLSLSRAYGSAECPASLEAWSANSPMLGCQRAGAQVAHHYVVIETEGLQENFQQSCEIAYGRWVELRFEDAVAGRYYSNRNKLECVSIRY